MKNVGTMCIKNLRYLCLVGVIALGLMTIVGTGGGGGGGGGASSGITYTGIETQATITDGNAEDFLTGAYESGRIGTAFDINAIQTGESAHIGYPRMLKVSRVLEGSLRKVDFASRSDGTFIGAIKTKSETVLGNCGGNFSYEISFDDQTGDFNGSFKFNDYCDDGVTITGGVSFYGQVDVNSPDYDLLTFTFSFNSLSFTFGSDSFTLNGNISWDVTGSSATITITMLLRDNSTGKVYWVQNYTLTLTEGVGYVDIEVSGRYYDPDYGYVDITTPTPLRIYDNDDYPSSGVLVVEGEDGTAGGPTRARLTAVSSTTYQVTADTNGDGSYDWGPVDLNW
jgi:hypothetical protein